jgi:hypothetical protein
MDMFNTPPDLVVVCLTKPAMLEGLLERQAPQRCKMLAALTPLIHNMYAVWRWEL